MIQQKKQYQIKEDAAKACAQYISDVLSTYKQVLLFYSGGSSLQVMPYIRLDFQHKITFCAVDERFDIVGSNFATLKREYPHFYIQALQHGHQFIDTSPHQHDQYEMASWLEQQIQIQLTTYNLQLITLLGMGEDGHIAGILPFREDEDEFNSMFVETHHLVAGYDATGKNQHTKRFTLTYRGLDLSNEIVLFAAGEKKQTILDDVEKNDYPLFEKPVKYVFETKIPVSVFTSV